MTTRSRTRSRWLTMTLAALVSGCSTTPVDPALDRSAAAIVGGVPDGDGGADAGLDPVADAVVAIILDDGHLCSGTLIAPDVVLTARHCVSNTSSLTALCEVDGPSAAGARFTGDKPPGALRVYLGRSVDARRAPAALGTRLIHTADESPCNADLALLVLDRRVSGARPLPVRRYGPALAGESLRAVGYGRTESGAIGERRRRDGVAVLAVGPGVSDSHTALGPRELEATQSFCDGDSGGPALSRAGAVVAVASRGPACTALAGYVYTAVSGFRALLEEAERSTGSSIALEAGDSEDAARNGPADGGDGGREGGADAAQDAAPDGPAYDRGLPASCAFAPPTGAGPSTTLAALLACLVGLAVRRRQAGCVDGRRSARLSTSACRSRVRLSWHARRMSDDRSMGRMAQGDPKEQNHVTK